MAKSVPQWPPAPIGLDEADFVEQLAEDALAAAAEAEVLGGGAFGFQDFEGDFQAPWMIAATDGSARDGVAAYSVVFPGGRGGGCGDASEDQTPFSLGLSSRPWPSCFRRCSGRQLWVSRPAPFGLWWTVSPPSMHWPHRRRHACRFLRLRRPRV